MAGTGGRYPSTPHLPFSPCVQQDDIVMQMDSLGILAGPYCEEVVVTEKLDGGNCCIYEGVVYARTHSKEASHASFSPIKPLARQIMYEEILRDIALFGENMFGIHSIEYDRLSSYFYLFGARNVTTEEWLSWDEVVTISQILEIPTVPVLFRGQFTSPADLQQLLDHSATNPSQLSDFKTPEGFVVRVTRKFERNEFSRCIGKYVRQGHVQTESSWLNTWKKAELNPK